MFVLDRLFTKFVSVEPPDAAPIVWQAVEVPDAISYCLSCIPPGFIVLNRHLVGPVLWHHLTAHHPVVANINIFLFMSVYNQHIFKSTFSSQQIPRSQDEIRTY